MGVIIDIIGMLVIRASIIAIILNLMVNLHEALYKYTERNYLNNVLTGAAQTISADLKLAGYNSSNKRFPLAQTNNMSFRIDYDDDGDVDIIRYYLSPTTGSNKVLYRMVTVNVPGTDPDSTIQVARDVDSFYVYYYRANGANATSGSTTNVNNIKSVYVKLKITSKNQEVSAQDGTSESAARTAKWEQHFFPENL
ncbi:MAG: hypothetical protein HUU02_15960 [Bacteroidetes bacterium]|nr:hypothetical protein [Bacteroidota bacterium]